MTRRGVLAPRTAPHGWIDGAILAFGAAVVVASEFVVIGMAPAVGLGLDLSVAQVGWFVTWFAIGSAVLGPIAVMAVRRMRSDHAMILALLPFAGMMLTPLIETVWVINLLRVLQGAALPLFISVASDSLRQLWSSNDHAVARIYLGVVAGTVVAAPAGATIAELWSWQTTFLSLGILSSLAVALIWIRASLRLEAIIASGPGQEALAFLRPGALLHLALSLTQFAAMFCIYAYVAVILEDVGVAKTTVGAWLILFRLAGMVGNWFAGRAPAAYMREVVLATVALLMTVTLVLPFLIPTPILLFVILSVWGTAHAASFVICQLRVTRVAPEAPRLAAAMNISAANIGIAFGSAIGGEILEVGGLAGLSAAGLILCTITLILALSARYPD